MREYNGGLTREQFLFYEIRIMASLVSKGYTKAEAIEKITKDNLFQFPTERMITNITTTTNNCNTLLNISQLPSLQPLIHGLPGMALQ